MINTTFPANEFISFWIIHWIRHATPKAGCFGARSASRFCRAFRRAIMRHPQCEQAGARACIAHSKLSKTWRFLPTITSKALSSSFRRSHIWSSLTPPIVFDEVVESISVNVSLSDH